MEEKIKIGVANEKEISIGVEELKTWEPKKISYFNDVVYFKHDGVFYSIKRLEFDKHLKK
jgi:hypothetical protein